MDIVTGIIKLLFGSKADKDRKAIEPYVNKIKEVYPSIAALSNDELRGRSQALMKQIADFIAPDEERIVTLKAQLERAETALEEKEKISKEIDEITKRIDEKIEQKLDEILPEAFAIMKDTARRFAENETVTVTANDFDRSWPPRRISSRSTATRPSTPPTGSRAATTSNGTWCTTTCSSSAAWCSTRARSPRWPRAKERPS